MSEELIQLKAKERHFLEQLLDGKKLENYKIPVPINAELRKYQQVKFCSYLVNINSDYFFQIYFEEVFNIYLIKSYPFTSLLSIKIQSFGLCKHVFGKIFMICSHL